MATATAAAPTAQARAFGIRRVLRRGYEDTLARVPEALQSEGFGVLTEIDVRDTLKRKLGIDFRRYKILGACNPPLAHRALEAELEVGLMLPCNVIVYDAGEGQTVVCAIDPMQTVAARGTPALAEVAASVREKLQRALDRLT
jgi:uncharacterized protein (DUF302 family)